MTAFLLLTAALLGVALCVRRQSFVPALADSLNWWVLYIALPAAVLELVPRLRFDPHLWYLAAAQWLGCAVAMLVFPSLGRRLGWSRSRIAAAILLSAFSNTSFVGLPMMEGLRGELGMSYAVIADQLGCFALFNTLGTVVIALYAGTRPAPADVARRVLLFPAFGAMVLALAVGAAGGWPDVVTGVLHRVAGTLAPLAMFSVGLRLRLVPPKGAAPAAGLVLGWKLALMPLLALLVGRALGVTGVPLSVAVMETGMAPMFTAAILCRRNGFDPEFSDAVLGIGLLASLVSVPLWSLVLP
jgi:predicted permease